MKSKINVKYFIVLLGLVLSFNLYSQNPEVQSVIEWVDRCSDFSISFESLKKVLKTEAKEVIVFDENKEFNILPHINYDYQDVTITVSHDNKRALQVVFIPLTIDGKEKTRVYIKNKVIELEGVIKSLQYGRTSDGKYFIYDYKSGWLTLSPVSNSEYLSIKYNYFK